MEENIKKCSFQNHKENIAILFCQECKIYMCKKCEKHHSELFNNHRQLIISQEEDDIFTGLCNEKNHLIELKFFCKTHNKLCCAECITKIKGDEYGQHTNCEICTLKEIKEEKMNTLKENIKKLEELSINIKETVKSIKLVFEKVDEDKEKLKLDIQKIFTNLRNELNKKEDEILLQIDKEYEKLFFDENFARDIEKFPNKIDKSLKKGRSIEKIYNQNNQINSLINDCLNIENNLIDINKINTGINKFKSFQNKRCFVILNDEIKQITEYINNSKIIFQTSESDIINKDKFDKISEWIGGNHAFILRYSAKRDGCNTDIFHQKCDNIAGSVIICQPKDNDIIGGYISTKILKDDRFYDDNKAFLFNLNKNFVKKNKKSYKNAIKNFRDSSYFIRFGNDCCVFILSENCLNDKNSCVTYCTCSTNFSCDVNNLFNSGQMQCNFKVENFEVFEVV